MSEQKAELKKKEKYLANIDAACDKLETYLKKHKDILSNVPGVRCVVYSKIFYPIIYEINNFYYLGGQNLYFILKSKCIIKNTGKNYYYEAIASEEDEILGKSPIIPVGCPNNKNRVYPGDIAPLEIKL